MCDLLTVQNLTVHIANHHTFKKLNFSLQAGDCLGILGSNGVGKTTVLHTLAGLLSADGNIKLLGNNITSYSIKKRAQLLGILMQQHDLPAGMSVFEIAISGRYAHRKFFQNYLSCDIQFVKECLYDCSLLDKHQQSQSSLSSGERQRLAAAILLIQNPKLYLLDEPFNNLDIKNYSLILNKFGKNSGRSSVVILHDLHIAKQMCSHLLLLNQNMWRWGTVDAMYSLDNMQWLYGAKLHTVSTDSGDIYLPSTSSHIT